MTDVPSTIRVATAADIETICAHRLAMFLDMGIEAAVPFDTSIAAFRAWVLPRVESGEYVGFLVERDCGVVAGAGLWMMPWPPTPASVVERRGYVLNVYTAPAVRGQGLARQLMETILARCGRDGIEMVTLHASDAGRPLYESMGFAVTNEMRLRLAP